VEAAPGYLDHESSGHLGHRMQLATHVDSSSGTPRFLRNALLLLQGVQMNANPQ
jgi:hypothetical protein